MAKKEDDGDEKTGGKGKMIAIIAVAALVVLGGTGAGLYFMGFLDSMLGMDDHMEEEVVTDEVPTLGTPVYYDLPEFTADLKTGECRAPFVKLSLTIQIDQLDQQIVIDREPKIIDRFTQHLRSKTRQELSGKGSGENLRTELTLILNATIKPATVQNVLFHTFIVQ